MAKKNLLKWKDQLLLLVRSSGCLALRAVTIAVLEHSLREERENGRQRKKEEEEENKSLFDYFVDEMSGICAETGIKFTLQYDK